MLRLPDRAKASVENCAAFIKWLLYSCLTGVVVGLVAVAFHVGIDIAAGLREEYPQVIVLLPLAGPAIILLYGPAAWTRTAAPTTFWRLCGTRRALSCAPRR